MTAITPLFEPGDRIPVRASGALTAGRFVEVSADIDDSGPALSATTGGGNIVVNTAGAGGLALGVIENDVASGAHGTCICKPGAIVPVMASGSITAGTEVAVGTAGKAIVASASKKAVGYAVSTASDGEDVYVRLYAGGGLVELTSGDNYAAGTPQADIAAVGAATGATAVNTSAITAAAGEATAADLTLTQALEVEFSKAVTDIASLYTAVAAHRTAINAIIATLDEYGMTL